MSSSKSSTDMLDRRTDIVTTWSPVRAKKIKRNRMNIFFGRLGNNSLKFIYFETAFFIKMSKINWTSSRTLSNRMTNNSIQRHSWKVISSVNKIFFIFTFFLVKTKRERLKWFPKLLFLCQSFYRKPVFKSFSSSLIQRQDKVF